MLFERFQSAEPASNPTPPNNIELGPGTMLAIHDDEIVLEAPDRVTKSIRVQIDMEPNDGGCVIWGIFSEGVNGCIEVRKTNASVDLPFVRNRAYLMFLPGTTRCRIKTIGWRLRLCALRSDRDDRRAPQLLGGVMTRRY